MYTESMITLAMALKANSEVKGRKHVEVCKHCGKHFVTDDAREFCSYDCQKTA